ncbi:FtsK/SpoIIIE domain-containing protein [Arthrobacter sp. AZCC_0090]|uniref:FtsK/SpoIIIE domain-containing protein n=1 Tax=Arthrobacter sp. AZCC_0090 TaxID=2735881 RepID=UPI00161C817F|nr:FtsK/SpoIIIE domain-containing protein [Arthrobacter sp. AZCC_0090]MBB6403921.1 S-DNA-T family DNA segregation ATPase FtsK/SpoIIIE [Arthrobacter sp. AZCC_0090]
MTFHCTLVRGPRALRQAEPVELTLAVGDGSSGSHVQAAVAAEFGTGKLMVDGLPLESLTVGAAPLVSGAVLVDGADSCGQDARDGGRTPATLSLLVHTGPAAGLIIPLERGSYGIGRSSTDICLPDPDVSRVHAVLTVSETALTISDNQSVNGTRVDGRKIRSAFLSTASRIQCGRSAMSVVFGDGEFGAESLGKAGLGVAEPLSVQTRSDTYGRVQLLLTAGLPLLLGVGIALATGMWMFLGFTAISAIAVLAPAISGRRQRRLLAAALEEAVEQDRARRRWCSPSAAELAFAVRSTASAVSDGRGRKQLKPPLTAAETVGWNEIWLRLGVSPQNALVALDPADPRFEPPQLGPVPMVLDPTIQTVSFAGPEAKIQGMFRFLLMQLAAFPSASNVAILIHGPIALLPFSARFLPRVTMTTDVRSAAAILSERTGEPGALFLVGSEPDPDDDSLRQAAAESGWRIFQRAAGGDAGICLVEFWNRRAVLRSCLTETEFDPDFVQHPVFDRYCRSLAAVPVLAATNASVVPPACLLAELLPNDPSSIAARWSDSSARSGLTAVIGRGTEGPRSLDLVSDGPHLLVAGTTGSGKSELLRTIVTAISLTHSPERVNFLFVDFKGGSGLGPLIDLPQCVGMLTDLSEHELERTLVSLRAEVRMREAFLAEANVPDLPAYRARVGGSGDGIQTARKDQLPIIPRLVLVIDEFRMLVEDAPAALAELMRIATLGRSLGIHLVMATQRPQGALSADIRANVTTSIALRVQSDWESRDIINSPAAASIPVSLPGRAYLVRGAEEAELFQTATLTSSEGIRPLTSIVARTAAEWLGFSGSSGNAEEGIQNPGTTPAEAARPIIKGINRVWTTHGGRPPRRPVADALPESIAFDLCLSAAASAGKHAEPRKSAGGTAYLGLVDLPSQQRVTGLTWTPSLHGNLGLVGPPANGVEDACRAAFAQLVGSAEELHFYVLDGDGAFAGVAAGGRVGAVASVNHAKRAARILERLANEMSARRARGDVMGEVPLLLVISGWGSWISELRNGPLAWAEDLVHTIVRDGPKSGLTVLVTGDRELVASRMFASIPNRAYFPLGATEETRLAWPRFTAIKPLKGRAVASGNFLDVDTAVTQFVAPPPSTAWPSHEPPNPMRRPFRVEPLPHFVRASDIVADHGIEATAPSSARVRRAVLLGLGGDEHEPVWITLPPSGVLLALGVPGSGKSSLLTALPLLNPGLQWQRPPRGTDPDAFWADFHRNATSKLVGTDTNLLVDDAEQLSRATGMLLAELPTMGFSVVATAAHSPALLQRTPLASLARAHGNGILLGKTSPTDGDLFGVRVDVELEAPPGRAVLIENGRTRPVQIAAPE